MLAAAELHAGKASCFASYFAHVPRDFHSLGHWTSQELQELQDGNLALEVCCWRIPENSQRLTTKVTAS